MTVRTTATPSADDLRRFLLGTLPPAEAEQVAAWVQENPAAAEALRGAVAHDSLTEVLLSTDMSEPPADPTADRVIRTVGRALTSNPPDQMPMPERFGGYRVVRKLGHGGMGVVYEATDELLSRRAAIKVMGGTIAVDESARQRFLREGRAVAALKSDHVVTIYQVGEESGAPFLAMEYLEGASLEEWLKGRTEPVTVTDVLWVARDVLTGLAAAHEKGLVHRDIKPGNLWVEQDTGRVKVLDFGLTRGSGSGEPISHEGAVVGTPAYMAPEQASGKAVDPRADLFSVGVVLHRMLKGRSPFQRDSVMATLCALATDTPEPVGELPPELSEFIARLMAKAPLDRPANAKAALVELRAIEDRLKAEPVAVGKREPSPKESLRKPRRNWLIATGLLGVLASTVLCIPFVPPQSNEGTSEPSPEKASPPLQLPPGASQYDNLDWAQIPASERFGWQPKELVAVIGTHARRLWARCHGIDISPDGTQFATWDGTGVVGWDLATRQQRWFIPGVPWYLKGGFTPDGRRLVVFTAEGIVAYDVTGKQPTPVAFGTGKPTPVSVDGESVEVLESGRTIACIPGNGDGVSFIDVSGEKSVRVGERLRTRGVSVARAANLIAYITPTGKVRIASVRNARPQGETELPIEKVDKDSKLAVSANGRRLAAWVNEELQVWDIAQQPPKILHRLPRKWHVSHSHLTSLPISFSPDGRWLVVRGRLFRIDGDTPLPLIDLSVDSSLETQHAVYAFSSDGNSLVLAGAAGIVFFWDLSGPQPKNLSPLDPGTGFIRDGILNMGNDLHLRNGRLLLKRVDGNYQLWDLTGNLPRLAHDPASVIPGGQSARPGPGDEWLISSGGHYAQGRFFRLRNDRWEQTGPAFREVWSGSSGEVWGGSSGSTMSGDEQRLVMRGGAREKDGGALLGWDVTKRPPVLVWELPVPNYQEVFESTPWGGNRHWLASLVWRDKPNGPVDLKLWQWNGPKPKPEPAATIPVGVPPQWYLLALSPDGKYLAHLKDQENAVVVVDLTSPEFREVTTLRMDLLTPRVTSLGFGPGGLLALGHRNGASVWEVTTGRQVWSWRTAPGPVETVQVSPDGRHLFTLNANHTVYVMRLAPPPAKAP